MTAKALPELRWRVSVFAFSQHASIDTFHYTGDVSLSAEDKPPLPPPTTSVSSVDVRTQSTYPDEDEDLDDGDYDDEPHGWLDGHTAFKFLMAGGVAGAGESTDPHLASTAKTPCSVTDMYRAI